MGDRQHAAEGAGAAGGQVPPPSQSQSQTKQRPPASPTAMQSMMSGIDWSIFKDGEEDAFGWLLRTNATAPPSASSEAGSFRGSGGDAADLPSDILPLDDINMGDGVLGGAQPPTASALSEAQQQQIRDQMLSAAATGSGLSSRSALPPSTQSLAAQIFSGLQSSSATPSPAVGPSPSMMRQLAEVTGMPSFGLGGGSTGGSNGSYDDFEDDEEAAEYEESGRNAEAAAGRSTGNSEDEEKPEPQSAATRSSGGKTKAAARATRGQTKTASTGTAQSKRPLKRKKGGDTAGTSAAASGSGEDDLEKKQQRRVKNLVSVREFRKRKMKQLEQNEARLHRLEAENMDLKMRLKIGKEAILSEQREKQQIKEQMREMLQRNANEQEIARFLNMYKVTYSDYGPKRREKLHFHLARIRELLLPTQVTKLCLYSVEQGVDMLARDHVIKEDPMAAPDSATATMSLWGILADELEVSDAQQRQILERRAAITKVRDDLNHTLSVVKQLEDVTDEKNTALEAQVAQLQQILTPSQATKFIIWVKENPAFMYMLDKLVDSTLMGAEERAKAE